MNTERLIEIRDWLLSGRPIVRTGHKFGFDLHSTIRVEEETGAGDCGSACCIAGAALLLSHYGDPLANNDLGWSYDFIHGFTYVHATYEFMAPVAAERLGLDDETAAKLFLASEWAGSQDHEDEIFDAWGGRFQLHQVTNEWAAAVIDNLVATGEVDWSVGRPSTNP